MKDVLSKNIFSFAVIALAAPLFEEWLCRGIVLKGLLKQRSPLKAIIISSIFSA
jgi:membrane protease YdiL (CAAX protease family)